REVERVVLDVQNGLASGRRTQDRLEMEWRLGRTIDPREFDPERAADAHVALDADGAAHGFDEPLAHGESEAGAGDASAGAEALEGHEEPVTRFGGDSGSFVHHVDDHATVGGATPRAHDVAAF